jgi:hypothetical protein
VTKEVTKRSSLSKEEQEKLIARYRAERQEGLRRFEAVTYPCPIDGKPGKYSGTVGTFQIVVPVFECPSGHSFSMRSMGDGTTGIRLITNPSALRHRTL